VPDVSRVRGRKVGGTCARGSLGSVLQRFEGRFGSGEGTFGTFPGLKRGWRREVKGS
jgi:hypothetical protein